MELQLRSFAASVPYEVAGPASRPTRSFPRGKIVRYSQKNEAEWAPRSESFGKQKKSLSSDLLVRIIVTVLTELSRLPIQVILQLIITAYKHVIIIIIIIIIIINMHVIIIIIII